METKSLVKSKDREFFNAIKPLVNRMETARTKKERAQAIRVLQAYLCGWLRALEYKPPRSKPMKTSHPKKTSSSWFPWLRRTDVNDSPPSPRSIETELESNDDDCDFSLMSILDKSATANVEGEYEGGYNSVSCAPSLSQGRSKCGPYEKSVAFSRTVSHAAYSWSSSGRSMSSSDEDEYDAPSFRLTYGDPFDKMAAAINADGHQPSVRPLSTNIAAYDSKKTYASYGFQSADDAGDFGGFAQLNNETDTDLSMAPVSSDQASDDKDNDEDGVDEEHTSGDHYIPDYVDNRAAMMKAILEQVTALFGGVGDDVGVEIVEVAPSDSRINAIAVRTAPQSTAATAGGNDRDEVESLRSSHTGNVRKMVGIFDKSRND